MEVSSNHLPSNPRMRRRSVLRSVFLLLLATVALFVFILVQGDARRRQRAMSQAQWHAANLAQRLGDTKALPLNLEPVRDPARTGEVSRVEWLSRDDALRLRRSDKRVLAAQTVSLPRVLAPDGRAAIFFEGGKFYVKWLTLPEFDRLYAAQQDEIRRLSAAPP